MDERIRKHFSFGRLNQPTQPLGCPLSAIQLIVNVLHTKTFEVNSLYLNLLRSLEK